MYENDAYQQRNANGFMNGKKINSSSSKLIKGIKGGPETMDNSYDINDRINEQKYVKLDFTSINKFGLNGMGNEDDGIIIIKDDTNNVKRKDNYENDKNSSYFEKMKLYENSNMDEENKSLDSGNNIAKKKRFSLFNDNNNNNLSIKSSSDETNSPNIISKNTTIINQIYSKANSLKSNDKMKTSSSFNKSDDIKNNTEDLKLIKESTSLLNNNDQHIDEGLLTTADKNENKLDTTSSSESLLNDATSFMQNKMVTFGNMTISNNRGGKIVQQSISTLNTTATNTTASTSASSNTSATSPTSSSSSTTNDELSNNSSSAAEICNIINSNHQSGNSTASEYSFINRKSIAKFSNVNKNHNHAIRSPRRFVNTATTANSLISPSLSPMGKSNYRFTPSLINSNNSSMNLISSDLMENKYLNKLCEEIEVSLNVDCECADDYSSNDFSGDYSFDAVEPNSPTTITNSNKNIRQIINNNSNNDSNNVNISHFTELRKNFEQNIKNQLRSVNNNNNNNNNHDTNGKAKSNQNNQDNQNLHIKNHFGVLV
jgi:hypothetical protein